MLLQIFAKNFFISWSYFLLRLIFKTFTIQLFYKLTNWRRVLNWTSDPNENFKNAICIFNYLQSVIKNFNLCVFKTFEVDRVLEVKRNMDYDHQIEFFVSQNRQTHNLSSDLYWLSMQQKYLCRQLPLKILITLLCFFWDNLLANVDQNTSIFPEYSFSKCICSLRNSFSKKIFLQCWGSDFFISNELTL